VLDVLRQAQDDKEQAQDDKEQAQDVLRQAKDDKEEDDDYHELDYLESLETEASGIPAFGDFIETLRRYKQQHPEEYW
jgi:hypothetical protein